jgi:hypothetical protein
MDLGAVRPTVIVIEASRAEACEAILLPNRFHREFFDGLNYYYVDDEAKDVSIFNYTPRVLQPGYVTDREQILTAELAACRSRLTNGVEVTFSERVAAAWQRCEGRLHELLARVRGRLPRRSRPGE